MATDDSFKTIPNPPVEPPGNSQRRLNEASSRLDLDPAYCLRRAEMIFACYRRDEAHDPTMYSAAIASILAGYPRSVVERATDPRTGIASESKFLPSVAEVREFCDHEAERQQRMARAPIPRSYEPLSRPHWAPGCSFSEMVATHGRALGPFEEVGDKWNRR
jgi:hypothetical protein